VQESVPDREAIRIDWEELTPTFTVLATAIMQIVWKKIQPLQKYLVFQS